MTPSTTGRLLVASPDLADPNFRRTVVLMVAHDDGGALGVVLNRPSAIPVDEGLPGWSEVATPPACVYLGGPVEPTAALGLGEGEGEPSDMIVGSLGAIDLSGRPEEYRSVRVFAGYAGWGPMQLDREIAGGDWFVLDARVEDVTTSAPDRLWREVLRRQRSRVAVFATTPDDPSLN